MVVAGIWAALLTVGLTTNWNQGVAGVPPPGGPRTQVIDGSLTPMGFHQYTTLNTSHDLSDAGTFTIPVGAHLAWIQAESQNVRWRDATYANGDTTDPTASVGMQIAAGDSIWYNGDLKAIEFIEEGASAKLNVSFYGR